MPTYEYACTKQDCGNRFDLVQSFSDPSATECPVCGQPVRKVYGAVGVVFKGSGFYRNDSRDSKGRAADAKSEAGASSATESKDSSSTKSDSASPADSTSKPSPTPKSDKPVAAAAASTSA